MSYDLSLTRGKSILLAVLIAFIIALVFCAGAVISMMLVPPDTVVILEPTPAPEPKVIIKMKECPPCKDPEPAEPEKVVEFQAVEKVSFKPAPKPVVAVKPPPPPKVEAADGYPYSLKLDSFKTLERVEKALKEYHRKGIQPYAVKVDLGEKGIWWRVFLGAYASKEEAGKAKQEFKLKRATIQKIRYANLIGLYGDQAELAQKIQELLDLGYYPYTVPGEDGEAKLLTGAFLSQQGVSSQNKDLASQGIQAQIMER